MSTSAMVADRIGTDVKKAASVIKNCGIAAIPTETFYGLAVNPADENAIRRLFQVKGRPQENPVLLLINKDIDISSLVAEIRPAAAELMRKHWPGPLTLVFKAGEAITPLLTGGSGKIGLRLSPHPLVNKIITLVGSPITGSSANLTGSPPCLTAKAVQKELGDKLDYILDGGTAPGGPGSTVVDVTQSPPKILRPGVVKI